LPSSLFLFVFAAARSEAEFPDWVDTPLDVAAKVRFQRYRGLQSFKTSAWDTNENLPKEYSKICQFQNYRHTYKVVVRQDSEDGPGFIPVSYSILIFFILIQCLVNPMHLYRFVFLCDKAD